MLAGQALQALVHLRDIALLMAILAAFRLLLLQALCFGVLLCLFHGFVLTFFQSSLISFFAFCLCYIQRFPVVIQAVFSDLLFTHLLSAVTEFLCLPFGRVCLPIRIALCVLCLASRLAGC